MVHGAGAYLALALVLLRGDQHPDAVIADQLDSGHLHLPGDPLEGVTYAIAQEDSVHLPLEGVDLIHDRPLQLLRVLVEPELQVFLVRYVWIVLDQLFKASLEGLTGDDAYPHPLSPLKLPLPLGRAYTHQGQ